VLVARTGILFCFARAVIPDQTIPFGAQRGGLTDGVPVHDLAVVISLVVNVAPLDWAALERVAEGFVLGSGPGKHGEEPALMLMDVGHVVGAGQLAIRDVKKISLSGQATEEIPGRAIGLVVGHIAASDLEIQRNRAVPRHREDIE
jgi:hypothetical protein